MSVLVNFGNGVEWNPTTSFFCELVEGYRRLCPSDAGMIHELEMIACVYGVRLEDRDPPFAGAFLTALEKSSRQLMSELLELAKAYPDDPAVCQKIEAHERLLDRIARIRGQRDLG